jgi:hypothetical protein
MTIGHSPVMAASLPLPSGPVQRSTLREGEDVVTLFPPTAENARKDALVGARRYRHAVDSQRRRRAGWRACAEGRRCRANEMDEDAAGLRASCAAIAPNAARGTGHRAWTCRHHPSRVVATERATGLPVSTPPPARSHDMATAVRQRSAPPQARHAPPANGGNRDGMDGGLSRRRRRAAHRHRIASPRGCGYIGGENGEWRD